MKTTSLQIRRTLFALVFFAMLAAATFGVGTQVVQADLFQERVFLPLISLGEGGTIPNPGQ